MKRRGRKKIITDQQTKDIFDKEYYKSQSQCYRIRKKVDKQQLIRELNHLIKVNEKLKKTIIKYEQKCLEYRTLLLNLRRSKEINSKLILSIRKNNKN